MYTNVPSTLFIITPNWKQPQNPSKSEWINKLEYPYDGLLLNNKKEQAVDAHDMDKSKIIMLNKRRQSKKVTLCIIQFI